MNQWTAPHDIQASNVEDQDELERMVAENESAYEQAKENVVVPFRDLGPRPADGPADPPRPTKQQFGVQTRRTKPGSKYTSISSINSELMISSGRS